MSITHLDDVDNKTEFMLSCAQHASAWSSPRACLRCPLSLFVSSCFVIERNRGSKYKYIVN